MALESPGLGLVSESVGGVGFGVGVGVGSLEVGAVHWRRGLRRAHVPLLFHGSASCHICGTLVAGGWQSTTSRTASAEIGAYNPGEETQDGKKLIDWIFELWVLPPSRTVSAETSARNPGEETQDGEKLIGFSNCGCSRSNRTASAD